MIRYWFEIVLLLFGCISAVVADQAPECRPLQPGRVEYDGPARFDQGLLWEIRSAGGTSHIFGTIHVADDEIVTLPVPVNERFQAAGTFVMEVVPAPEDVMEMAALMYFTDGRKLDALISQPLYRRVVQILTDYNLPEEAIAAMRPWSAYLTMSYPADMRPVLDLQLLEHAQAAGLATHGLESLAEQGRIFSELDTADQLRLLADTACHHDRLREDMEAMKRLYLQRDLKGMFVYGQKHAFADNTLYEELAERLLTRRNGVMADRLKPYLDAGRAFIAIGAMHLPGREGVLNRLVQQGYAVERVY
ncbi:MAG: TraB/GumN family protein [Gammaproteobacteria bacterium]|nr:TraB/GumN family protein [Gammaproteobacteria bacterium]